MISLGLPDPTLLQTSYSLGGKPSQNTKLKVLDAATFIDNGFEGSVSVTVDPYKTKIMSSKIKTKLLPSYKTINYKL